MFHRDLILLCYLMRLVGVDRRSPFLPGLESLEAGGDGKKKVILAHVGDQLHTYR